MRSIRRHANTVLITTFFVSNLGCVAGQEDSVQIGVVEQECSNELADEVRSIIEENDITPTAQPPAVSDELFELGQALAFDKILSGNRDVSCMTCHHPFLGSDDDRHLPNGVGGSGLGAERAGGFVIPRNAPALFNPHEFDTMFWDSRVSVDETGHLITPAGDQITPEMEAVLEFGVVSAQAMFPVTSRHEMRGEDGNELAAIPDSDLQGIWSSLMARLGTVPEYVAMFEAAYPGTRFEDMTFAHAANAIAGFEIRGFATLDSPWESFVAGNDHALGYFELHGAKRFFENGCASCHAGRAFSDFAHHNSALAQLGPGKGHGPTGTDDFGRTGVTGSKDDLYAFRTPPLVNIALTGPYGHDGQYADLFDFVSHYQDPVESLRTYDIDEHVDEEELEYVQLDNTADVIDTIDPLMHEVSLNKWDAKLITRFLQSLTADSAYDIHRLVPATVPSGLPVAD